MVEGLFLHHVVSFEVAVCGAELLVTYPLTTYSQARDQWMAYQLDRPDQGRGLVVALRRPDSPYEGARIPLRAIDVAATYDITNLDTNDKTSIGGQVLAQQGIPVAIDRKPGSALLTYQRR